MNERRALQDAHHRREDDAEEAVTDRSLLSVAVDAAWQWLVAAWVRAVGGALWAVTAFHLGVLLDAAGVPVVATARQVVAAAPVGVSVGSTGAALLLATVAGPVGAVWTLRWDGETATHHRRLLAIALLVVLPFVLSAVEMAVVGVVNAALAEPVAPPEGPIRAFYHVATTFAIAFGAALLWYELHTEREWGRWSSY